MAVWLSNAFYFLRIYLFSFRERGREGEREGEKHRCVRDTWISCLSHNPNWGPGPQPRHVPWLGIEPVTFLFTDQHSDHWGTPRSNILIKSYFTDSKIYVLLPFLLILRHFNIFRVKAYFIIDGAHYLYGGGFLFPNGTKNNSLSHSQQQRFSKMGCGSINRFI